MQQIAQPETTNWLVEVVVPLLAVIIPATVLIWLALFRGDKK